MLLGPHEPRIHKLEAFQTRELLQQIRQQLGRVTFSTDPPPTGRKIATALGAMVYRHTTRKLRHKVNMTSKTPHTEHPRIRRHGHSTLGTPHPRHCLGGNIVPCTAMDRIRFRQRVRARRQRSSRRTCHLSGFRQCQTGQQRKRGLETTDGLTHSRNNEHTSPQPYQVASQTPLVYSARGYWSWFHPSGSGSDGLRGIRGRPSGVRAPRRSSTAGWICCSQTRSTRTPEVRDRPRTA